MTHGVDFIQICAGLLLWLLVIRLLWSGKITNKTVKVGPFFGLCFIPLRLEVTILPLPTDRIGVTVANNTFNANRQTDCHVCLDCVIVTLTVFSSQVYWES